MGGYKRFRKDRSRKIGIALYVKEKFGWIEVINGDHESSVEVLWIKIRVIICYGPPNQDDEANKTLLQPL